MTRLKWPLSRALVITCSLFAASLPAAAAADAAGDGISRPPGAIDNRGWELVSLADKGGVQAGQGARLSADGDRVLYSVVGGVPGATNGARTQLIASRTSTGWISRNILPPSLDQPLNDYLSAGSTPDLSKALMSVIQGPSLNSPGMSWVTLSDTGQQTVLQTFPQAFDANGTANGAILLASNDLAHVFSMVPLALDPSHVVGTYDVYDVGSGTPVLVSRLPGGSLAPSCGVEPGSGASPMFATGIDASAAQHWVSNDGAKAFFLSRGDDPSCSAPPQLYRWDGHGSAAAGDDTSALLSGPVVTGDPDLGIDRFLQAGASGDWVIYRTATSLDAADDVDGGNSDMDIYRWESGVGNTCLTCVVANANLGGGGFGKAAVSEDGSHVYFTSTAAYAGAPGPASNGAPNTYVLSGGVVHFIARTNGVSSLPSTISNAVGDVTPDGNVLIFYSRRPELDALSGSENGGFTQYYRYDDRDQSITCVSCPAPGAAMGSPTPLLTIQNESIAPDLGAVSDDGSIVAFETPDALVPEDVNGGPDLYEWHDRTVRLITSGLEHYPGSTEPAVVTVSPSGRDILFWDPSARLTPDALDQSGKVYDARIDGGFSAPATAPAACHDEQCHGLPSTPPGLADPGSLSLDAAGNVTPPPLGRFTVARVTASQRATLARTGNLTLAVRVNRAGKVAVLAQAKVGKRTRVIARASKVVRRAGVVKVRLRLSRAARAQLEKAGRLRLVLGVGFSKALASSRVTVALKAPLHRTRAARRATVRSTADAR